MPKRHPAHFDAPEIDAEGNVRRHCTLPLAVVRQLEVLATKGPHGGTVSAVMTSLILQGVRECLDRGYITFADGDPNGRHSGRGE